MTVCTIVLTVVSCVIDPSTKVSPAEAARILAPYQFVDVPPPSREQRDAELSGPTVTIIPDSTPQPYMSPTYPLTNNSSTPFYPDPFYPSPFYPTFSSFVGPLYPGAAVGLSVTHESRRDREADHAAPLRRPLPPSPPQAPAKDDRPAPRGSLALGRLSSVR